MAKPYYDTVNHKVLTPAREYAVHYGAPWIEKGQEYALSKWEETAQPRFIEFQNLVQDRYKTDVEPHLTNTKETIGPYYETVKENSLKLYEDRVLPAVAIAQPYVLHAYEVSSDFAVNTAVPHGYWAYNKVYLFVDTAIWPQLRVLYVENVEPQLVRIGERLGRYRNKTTGNTIVR